MIDEKLRRRICRMRNEKKPLAWAVLLADGERIYDVYDFEEEAKAIDEAVTGNHGVVPLYRSPTLTDDERAAIEWCVEMAIIHATECDDEILTLRSLLERLGGER